MSAIPQVTAAVLAKLEQDVVGPTIVLGYDTAPELISIWECSFTREYLLLGGSPPPQNEKFDMDLIVEVLRPSGRSMVEASARCWEIFEQVDDALRGDQAVNSISWNALIGQGKQEFFQTAEQQGCRIRGTLSGTARI